MTNSTGVSITRAMVYRSDRTSVRQRVCAALYGVASVGALSVYGCKSNGCTGHSVRLRAYTPYFKKMTNIKYPTTSATVDKTQTIYKREDFTDRACESGAF